MLSPGDIFVDKYCVKRVLGGGGFATVYVAEHVRVPGPPVALKVLHVRGPDERRFRERFVAEVLVGRTIKSPHVVSVLDCDVTPQGVCYFTMELAPGESLGAILDRERTLTWRFAVGVTMQLLSALGEAHRGGVVHRDIKPDNVMVERRPSGEPFARVLDFGIAKLRDESTTGTSAGTPHYMSPEQVSGEPVDGRADLYAAGVLLQRMLTGMHVFPVPEGSDLRAIPFMHLTRAPMRLLEAKPDLIVPPGLQDVVLGALAKRPEERFQTADDMIAALDLVLSEGDTVAGRASRGGETREAPRSVPRVPLEKLEGQTIDRYRVERRIGGGGFGTVFLATHMVMQRPVALKVLDPALAADPLFSERFRREAVIAARVRDPNAVEVFDIGDRDGWLFIAMEYVEGESLAARIAREGAHEPRVAAAIIDRVLAALETAHKQGVVHRDVKPHNVLIDKEGVVKLCDFGIALLVGRAAEGTRDGERLTAKDVFIGSPEYASPELCSAEALDARADVYSCGVMLFELLTGKRPFTGTSVRELAEAQVKSPPPTLREARPDLAIPYELEFVVSRALAKKPAERFQTAAAMRAALSAAAESQPAGGASVRLRLERTCLQVGGRKEFVFATPSLPFGKARPDKIANKGAVQNVLVLRLLPPTPESNARSNEISGHHGEFMAQGEKLLVVDRSRNGIALEGVRIAKDVPTPLPPKFRLTILGGGLELSGRVVLGGRDARPVALRLERVGNAAHHAYVWVLGRVEVGPLDGALPIPEEPGLGAFLLPAHGRLALIWPAGTEPRLLIPGEALRGRSVVILNQDASADRMAVE